MSKKHHAATPQPVTAAETPGRPGESGPESIGGPSDTGGEINEDPAAKEPAYDPSNTRTDIGAAGIGGTNGGAPVADQPKEELRTDGPTLKEYVNAGYKAEGYPPPGFAAREEPLEAQDDHEDHGGTPHDDDAPAAVPVDSAAEAAGARDESRN